MNTPIKIYLYSAVLVMLLVACAAPVVSVTTSPPAATPIPPTTGPTPDLEEPVLTESSDPAMLAQIVGMYTYYSKFQLFLLNNGRYHAPFDSGTFRVGPDELIVTSDGVLCEVTPGSYHWSLNGGILRFKAIRDDCDTRKSVLEGQEFEQAPSNESSPIIHWIINPHEYNFATVDSHGNVFITDALSGFSQYDSTGELLKTWNDPTLTFTTGIAVDVQGNIYVANFDDATLHKYDAAGTPLLQWRVDRGIIGPTGVAIGPDGNVYVTLHRGSHDHFIEKYDPQGLLLGTWAPAGRMDGQITAGPRSGPMSIGLDALGNTFIGDDRRLVNKYDPEGQFLSSVEPLENVAVDKDGNLYSVDSARQNIVKYDITGNLVGKWLLPFAGDIIAMDPDGSVVIGGNAVIVKAWLP